MNLKSIIKGENESLEHFEDRTAWISNYESYVLVWNSKAERDNPNFTGKPEKWSTEKARRYVETLESEVETEKANRRDWMLKQLDECENGDKQNGN